MQTITFITGNQKKIDQLNRYVTYPVNHQPLDLEEIQSLDIAEVAAAKARAAYAIIGGPVLVEDAALACVALNGLPGTFEKWYLERLGTQGLIDALAAYDDKRAVAQVCYALCDETGVHLFQNERSGVIVSEPRGEANPFGWNPVFMPDGFTKTWAEMTLEESAASSLRQPAIAQFDQFVREHYTIDT